MVHDDTGPGIRGRETGPPAAGDERSAQRGRVQQGIIDAELRASRRAILTAFRPRLRTDVATLSAPDFLALADAPTVHAAVITAAQIHTGADGCYLQLPDPVTRSLRIVRQRGLSPELLHHLAGSPTGSACWRAGEPVRADDITASPLPVGRDVLAELIAVGIRAMHSYPLPDGGGAVLGVLTLLHHATGPHPACAVLARHAAAALTYLDGLPPVGSAAPDAGSPGELEGRGTKR